MSEDFNVGQAVVTDPLLEGASGYHMTAVSGSVAAEDRVHLTEFPQVSDYMHMEKSPASFLSFHQLPSGAWALSQRFVHGIRRRAYNRVVVHTLIIPVALLDAVLGDPWLLVAVCGYRDPEGQWRKFRDLSEFVCEPDVREVSDLQVQLPEDTMAARHGMLTSRREFLLRTLESEKTLYNNLAHVLGAIEARDKVLLPQELVMEQLLALAYSSLPCADRLHINWTTHLAIGGGTIFHLALTPKPAEARYLQSDPNRWVLLDEPLRKPGGGGEALAKAVALRFDRFAAIDAGLTTYRLSLLEQPDRLAGWINLALEEGGVPFDGFADAQVLSGFLERHRLSGGADFQVPGLTPTLMLETVALTVVNHYRKNRSWEGAVEAVSQTITKRQLGRALLSAKEVAQLIRRGATEREARAAMGSLALCLASPDWKDDQFLLVTLLEAAQNGGALAKTASLGATPVFLDLAESIARLAPEESAAAYRVVQENGGLAAALKLLKSRSPSLVQMEAILLVAQEVEDSAVASQVACDLVPLLAKESNQARSVNLRKSVLEAMRAAPEGLEQAFAQWEDGDLYDEAMQTLRQWADERLEGILPLAKCLAAASDNGVSILIRECPSILGTARTLAKAGIPAASWLPFAIVEASLIDRSGNQSDFSSFQDFLRRWSIQSIQEEGIERPLQGLLALFQQIPPVTSLGAAHRELVISFAISLGRDPSKAANALAQLASNPAADLLFWGEAVAAVAMVIAKTDAKTASQMVRNWWTGLTIAAPLQLDMFTPVSFQLLSLLSREDAAVVLNQWAPRITSLGTHTVVQKILGSFGALARQHNLRDQESLYSFASLAHQLHNGEESLAKVVEGIIRGAADSGQRAVQLESTMAGLFPRDPVERTRTILQLLLSADISPGSKEFVEKRFLDRALEIPPPGLVQALPSAAELAGRSSLLLRVSRQMGRRWPQWPDEARRFVFELATLERSDALASFFRGAEKVDENFVADLRKNNSNLYRILRNIVEKPVGRWDLSRVKDLRE